MATLWSRLRHLYELEVHLAERLQSFFLLAVRFYWGYQFMLTGWGKLTHLERTAGFFAGLGIPMPMLNATLAGTVECVGGALLLVGLASRVVALPLIFTMIVAYATAHLDSVREVFSNPDGFVTQAPFLFLMASVIVLLFGPGRFSLDAILSKARMSCPMPMMSGASSTQQTVLQGHS